MKASIYNNEIIAFGDIDGTSEQGVYTIVGEIPKSGTPMFYIDGESIFITGVRQNIEDIIEDSKDLDYKQIREKIKQVVKDIGFINLSSSDQILAAKWFACSNTEIDQVLSIDEKIEAGIIFNEESIKSRSKRFERVKTLFNSTLSTQDAIILMNKVMQYDLETLYVKMGFEGKGVYNYKGSEDIASILDFLNGTMGTQFENDSLFTQGISPMYGLTLDDLKNKAVNIIKPELNAA